MICPHCNHEIEDKMIARHLAGKAGRVKSEAKRLASIANGRKHKAGYLNNRGKLGKSGIKPDVSSCTHNPIGASTTLRPSRHRLYS